MTAEEWHKEEELCVLEHDDEQVVMRAIDVWMVDVHKKRKVHCSNCKHAKVSSGKAKGFPGQIRLVTCAKGHVRGRGRNGVAVPLVTMIRPKSPAAFKLAESCDDFTSMGEEEWNESGPALSVNTNKNGRAPAPSV